MLKLLRAFVVLYRIAFVICVFIGMGVISWVEYKNFQYKKVADRLPAEIELAKRDGLWIEPLKKIPDRENAAVLYRKAIDLREKFKLHAQYSDQLDNALDLRLGRKDPVSISDAGYIVKQYEPIFQIVEQAVKLPRCEFYNEVKGKRDVFELELNYGESFCSYLTDMYSIKTMWENDCHDWKGALNSVEASLLSIRQFSIHPTIILLFRRNAEMQTTMSCLTRIINDNCDNPEFIKSAFQTIETIGPPVDVRDTTKYEINAMHQNLSIDMKTDAENDSNYAMDEQLINPSLQAAAMDAVSMKSYREVYDNLKYRPYDYKTNADFLNKFSGISKRFASKPGYELAADMNSVLPKAELRCSEMELLKRMTKLQIDILNYRLLQGTVPNNLSQLNIDIPLDPSNNEPFKYKRTAKGFELYSKSRQTYRWGHTLTIHYPNPTAQWLSPISKHRIPMHQLSGNNRAGF